MTTMTVLGGTEGNDTLYGDRGIDALWGDGGNDYLNAGTESDNVFGGDGDDIIEDPFGDDILRGNLGNDVISSARGADILFGDQGNDFILLGQDASEVFGGTGDDFILGGVGSDGLLGNEGNDWIEGGAGFDGITGDNSELFFNSPIIGHDVLFGHGDETDFDAESGDDIMAGAGGTVTRYNGMFGFDWGIAKNEALGVNYDLLPAVLPILPAKILRDRFDLVEAASGWKNDDKLNGDNRGNVAAPDPAFNDHVLTAEGIDRITGFRTWFGGALTTLFGAGATTFRDGNILLGGDGNDFLQGRGGNDLLDGDAWLNVRIKIVIPFGQPNAGTYSAESLNTDKSVSGQYAGKVFNTDASGNPIFTSPAFNGASLTALLLNRTINPGQMSIVREILDGTIGPTETDTDTAVFQGTLAQYVIEGRSIEQGGTVRAFDLNGDGFISVRDTRVVATNEGTDLLKNIERVQFSDQTVNISNEDITVFSAVSRTLTLNENHLVLTGTAAISGTGNHLANIITGNSAANTLIGNAGNDTLIGNDGNDVLRGGAGADSMDGGIGIDIASYYYDSSSPITVNLTTNVNTGGDAEGDSLVNIENVQGSLNANSNLTGNTDNNVLYAYNGNDNLNGEAGNDILYGGAGNDNLSGGIGNDYLYGQADNDSLNGGDDNDVLYGGAGNDNLNGDLGNDYLYGEAGDDSLNGGDGSDILYGGAGNDALNGGAGNDYASYYNFGVAGSTLVVNLLSTGNTGDAAGDTYTNIEWLQGSRYANNNLTGDTLNNRLYSYDGNDTLNGGGGSDILSGGNGNDLYIVDGGDAVSEALNSGNDTVESSASFGLAANIENLVLTGTAAISGTGNTLANVITGNNVVNTLVGDAGNDTLLGNDGNDVLRGGSGADSLDGGNGNDLATYYYDSSSPITVNLTTNVNTGGDAQGDSLVNIENVQGSLNANSNLTGNSGSNVLYAYNGNDILNGEAGNDVLYGGAGNDNLNGGADIDYLYGQAGDDTLNGDAGNDVLYGGTGNDVIDGGADVDIISYYDAIGPITVNLTLNTGTAGTDVDTLSNIENIQGSQTGNSDLTGNGSNNVLYGYGGNDKLNGNGGNDYLISGAGSDEFVFAGGAVGTNVVALLGTDTLADFAVGTDKIVLSQATFSALTIGGPVTLAIANTAAELTTAGLSNSQLIYSTGSGRLYYNANGTAAGFATGVGGNSAFAILSNFATQPALSATDILVTV
jgi:Ca2+-binding RTX toxin-like protein